MFTMKITSIMIAMSRTLTKIPFGKDLSGLQPQTPRVNSVFNTIPQGIATSSNGRASHTDKVINITISHSGHHFEFKKWGIITYILIIENTQVERHTDANTQY